MSEPTVTPRRPRPRRLFAFRPWVRSTCRRAMLWGTGILLLLAAVTWALQAPGAAPLSRAFGVLAAYAAVFLVTLGKIWWTAGRPAVVLDDRHLHYRPLHLFRVRRVALDDVLAVAPRRGTGSLSIAHLAGADRGKVLHLNLSLIQGRGALLGELGERLAERGLIPVRGRFAAWRRPGFDPEEADL